MLEIEGSSRFGDNWLLSLELHVFLDQPGNDRSLLTPREREVLQLLAESKSTKEIADILHLSARTVETYRLSIMDKLDIHDIAGLTKFAIREGVISLDS